MNMSFFQSLEQLQAMLRDFSPLLYSYKQELVKQGFTDEQAFELVRDYQKIVFNPNSKGE